MVLDDLYCGNIYPAEQVVPHEKEYRKLHRHTGELLTELEEKLSKEQMKLVNQFHTHIIDVHCMELEAQFQYGFSLGMALPSSPQHRTRRKSRSRSWTRIPRYPYQEKIR